MYKLPERDWKVVKKLHPILLQRYCQQVFEDVHALTEGDECDYQAAYLKLYKLVRDRNKNIGHLFDGFSRGQATMMIMTWKRQHLITEEELAMFSDETQAAVDFSE
ncbi:hypothetical protein [Endozoicomonas sp.]|uniref:hypothetical protein n=1 Tax=Endozoicomonas sp. TaxID=1892382 RepID=UPI003AF9EC1A